MMALEGREELGNPSDGVQTTSCEACVRARACWSAAFSALPLEVGATADDDDDDDDDDDEDTTLDVL